MQGEADHIIDEMVENMTSKLYFHGHPIREWKAAEGSKLKVCENCPLEVETLMWELYLDFDKEFEKLGTFLICRRAF